MKQRLILLLNKYRVLKDQAQKEMDLFIRDDESSFHEASGKYDVLHDIVEDLEKLINK